MPRQSSLPFVFDFIGLVRRAPRTAAELAELMECHVNTISKYLDLAEQEGLIECIGTREGGIGRAPTVFRWVELGSPPRVQSPS